VLWAGVPIITLPGELMVTRGASSLLLSGGGAMTIARTFEDYEDLVRCALLSVRWSDLLQAMALLMRPSALARARAALRNCRTECNLFRTRDVWVPNWEVVLLRMIVTFLRFQQLVLDSFLLADRSETTMGHGCLWIRESPPLILLIRYTLLL
jgi:hypothetical protein